WLKTVTISPDGLTIALTGGSLEFDLTAQFNRIFHIYGNVYAIAYMGPDLDGWIKTVTISEDGLTIALTGYSLEFSTSRPITGRLNWTHVTGNVYAIVWTGSGSDGYLYTVTIGNDGTLASIASIEFNLVTAIESRIFHISGDVYAIAFGDSALDGWFYTYSISAAGAISDRIALFEFETDYYRTNDIAHISGNIFTLAYDSDDIARLRTVSISPDGVDMSNVASISIGGHDIDFSMVHVGGNVYAVSFSTVLPGRLRTYTIPDS
ncbi:unnamed protein product, partial [marine sediment metagenome]